MEVFVSFSTRLVGLGQRQVRCQKVECGGMELKCFLLQAINSHQAKETQSLDSECHSGTQILYKFSISMRFERFILLIFANLLHQT